MEIKTLPVFSALCYTEKTNNAGLQKLVRIKARELYTEAINRQIEITGPLYWNYYGMDGNPETLFTLEIAIPVVVPTMYNGVFVIKEIPGGAFACLTHYGIWESLSSAYGVLIPEILQAGYTMIGFSREIYLNMDFNNPQNHVTEIQVGVK